MELLFCGTSSCEGLPALFCNCRICTEARQKKAKFMRSRSAFQLGEEIRIDCGPDILYHQHRYGLSGHLLKHLFITHSHRDHCFLEDMLNREVGLSSFDSADFLTIYGNETTIAKANSILSNDPARYMIKLQKTNYFESISLPAYNLRVTPLKANHAPEEQAMLFLFEFSSGKLLIANDTAYFPVETIGFLDGLKLDTLVIDANGGKLDASACFHLGGSVLLDLITALHKQETLDEKSKVIATHFSHNNGDNHDQLNAYFKTYNIITAYDGMTKEI